MKTSKFRMGWCCPLGANATNINNIEYQTTSKKLRCWKADGQLGSDVTDSSEPSPKEQRGQPGNPVHVTEPAAAWKLRSSEWNLVLLGVGQRWTFGKPVHKVCAPSELPPPPPSAQPGLCHFQPQKKIGLFSEEQEYKHLGKGVLYSKRSLRKCSHAERPDLALFPHSAPRTLGAGATSPTCTPAE